MDTAELCRLIDTLRRAATAIGLTRVARDIDGAEVLHPLTRARQVVQDAVTEVMG